MKLNQSNNFDKGMTKEVIIKDDVLPVLLELN